MKLNNFVRINNYEKIGNFFKLNGFTYLGKNGTSKFDLNDIQLIDNLKNNLDEAENRKKILNIYFTHSYLYIRDIEEAFGLRIDNRHLLNSLNQIIVVADILLDYEQKEINDIVKLNFQWDIKKDESLGTLLNDDSIDFFKKRIKELELKSVFFSDDEFKREMKKPVRNWLIEEIKKSGFIQKIYDELPEIIVEIVDDYNQ
jgi:hypothetical protein